MLGGEYACSDDSMIYADGLFLSCISYLNTVQPLYFCCNFLFRLSVLLGIEQMVICYFALTHAHKYNIRLIKSPPGLLQVFFFHRTILKLELDSIFHKVYYYPQQL